MLLLSRCTMSCVSTTITTTKHHADPPTGLLNDVWEITEIFSLNSVSVFDEVGSFQV